MDRDSADWGLLCRVEDVAEGQAWGGLPTPGAARKVIVLRHHGVFHGWLDACPHYENGTPMAWKSGAYLNGSGTRLACHSHGAEFDMATGECVLGPCLGRSLTRVELPVADDGSIFAATPLGRKRT